LELFLERGNPVDAVLSCEKNLVQMHCADANFHTSERLIPGKGEFGFTKFIHVLKQINYQGYLSIELWGPDPDTLAWESRIYLENLL